MTIAALDAPEAELDDLELAIGRLVANAEQAVGHHLFRESAIGGKRREGCERWTSPTMTMTVIKGE